ncbi:hypothetical protein [Nocardia stercoris]|uniref:Uncharacterized protein n=1 Tax=Nocardia stercoris TaxID=2483361 RepID=A0A3M2KV78_9NOCA|nr:hypothetical protein [Nocardia stercoris]RMI29537.1 hypothetical protein EBN03_26065 [Nocardia stercoris]
MWGWLKKAASVTVSFALPAATSFILPPLGGMVGGALGTYLADGIEGKGWNPGDNWKDIALGGAMGGLGGGGAAKLFGKTLGEGSLLSKFAPKVFGKTPWGKAAAAQADKDLAAAAAKVTPNQLSKALGNLTKDEVKQAEKEAAATAGKSSGKAYDKALKDAKEAIAKQNAAKARVAAAAAKNAANAKPWYKNTFDWSTGKALGAGGLTAAANMGQPDLPVPVRLVARPDNKYPYKPDEIEVA